MKKYELTTETKTVCGITFHRIRAIMSFRDGGGVEIAEGELGGWVEKESNLSHDGGAWVYGNAEVYGNARVCGSARVYGNAEVYGNARVYGSAWVYGNAEVYGNARVYGDAEVYGDAWVCGDAWVSGLKHYMTISPIGSRDDFVTFFRTKSMEIYVKCGCFKGNIDQFLTAVQRTHGDNEHAKAYRLAADLAKARIDLTPDEEAEAALERRATDGD